MRTNLKSHSHLIDIIVGAGKVTDMMCATTMLGNPNTGENR